jgi:5-methyltetrahydrofolate--homocysteine methyltransferase
MIIIGEKINATRKAIAAALKDRDAGHVAQVAAEQVKAGAHYLDINGGDPSEDREVENVAWLLDVVQSRTDSPVSVDSASPKAVRAGLSRAGRKPILNSVSLERSRLEPLLPIVGEFDCMVVALLVSDNGPPCGVDDRVANAGALIDKLTAAGKRLDEIIVDPCFLPISTDASAGVRAVQAIAEIRKRWPEVHIGGGVSNASYGLPKRRYVNLALLSQAILHGMDAAIIDPCTEGIMATIHAAEALAGRDEFCMNYVTAEREGRLT